MNSGMSPSLIGPNAVAFARNVAMRGARPTTRPGWNRRSLVWHDTDQQVRFENGLFQGAAPFEPFEGGQHLVASIAGRLFEIDVTDRYSASEITISDLNNSTLDKAWFEQ